MDKKQKDGLRTWIEIDKKALNNNYKIFRSIIPKKCRLMSVVKSNAYGHGLVDFSKEISRLGADWLGVDTVVEALALRREGIKKPILILGYTRPSVFKEAVEADISITISTFESLEALEKIKTKKPIKIHIKVDTGMGRQGFLPQDLSSVLKSKILNLKSPSIFIEGLYTHFAAAKNPSFPKYTYGQIEQFKKWVEAFHKAGFKPIIHSAASSGTLIFPESHFDMVRVGISFYGLWPSPEVKAFSKDKYKLQPILTWKTIVSEVKVLPKGSGVGYDLIETLEKDTKVAVCPIGYWHGYPRAFSSIGRVLIGGKQCRVIGRVSMDMIVIDVFSVKNVKVEDEVVILGKQGPASHKATQGKQEKVTADELATLSGTTNYEVVTRINPLIKRFYV